MKSKKLLISIAVLAVVIVIIVVLSAVFSIRRVTILYHGEDGSVIAAPTDGSGIASDDILKISEGKSIVFLSKDKLLSQINTDPDNSEWHAFAVIKNFPNMVEVHLARRSAIAKIDVGGSSVYVDFFGCVAAAPDSGTVIDISSAFRGTETDTLQVGTKFAFRSAENNERLGYVLEAIKAIWRCKVEVGNIPEIIGKERVFTFDDDGNLYITPNSGGTIKILAPSSSTMDLSSRVVKGLSVYYTDVDNMQNAGAVITVHQNGRISTPTPEK